MHSIKDCYQPLLSPTNAINSLPNATTTASSTKIDCDYDVVYVINGNIKRLIDKVLLFDDTDGQKEGGVYEIASNSNTSTIYADSYYDSGGYTVLYAINRSNPKNTRISEIPIAGNSPEGIAVNLKTNRVYSLYTDDNHPISNKTTSKLFSIDGNSNKILSILYLNTILKNIAVNPSTNLVYLLGWNCNNACDYKDAGKSVLLVVRHQTENPMDKKSILDYLVSQQFLFILQIFSMYSLPEL